LEVKGKERELKREGEGGRRKETADVDLDLLLQLFPARWTRKLCHQAFSLIHQA